MYLSFHTPLRFLYKINILSLLAIALFKVKYILELSSILLVIKYLLFSSSMSLRCFILDISFSSLSMFE